MSTNRTEEPCGCWRAITERQVPSFNEEGNPILDENNVLVTEIKEQLEEGYCDEHSRVIAERQVAVQRALAAGASADDATLLMLGQGDVRLQLPAPASTPDLPDSGEAK